MAATLEDTLVGASRGLHSNWLWHRPLQIVVDAGEGLAAGLGSRVLQPTHLLLTHGHSDHVLGLPGFVSSRRFALGDPDKPITILFPELADGVRVVRQVLEGLWPGERFPVAWTPVRSGDAVALDGRRGIEVFAADHPAPGGAVGYRVVETRRRLRPEFRDQPQEVVRQLAAQGRRDEATEEYRHILFAHTGDSMPVDPTLFTGADLLVHDATFLDVEDRREPLHATAAEALATARAAGVKRLLLHHVSVRYEREAALPRLRDLVAESGFAGECWLLHDDRLISVGQEDR
jgi:ribonuclease Z